MYTGPVLILILILLIAIPASADWKFDFEAGLPSELELTGAAVTDDTKFVISGSKSVICDRVTDGDSWHEFLSTKPEVKLQKGRLYRISYRYRIIDPGGPEERFYTVFKSREGGEIYGNFWMWNREKGATGRIDRLIRPDNDGYRVILGVRGKAAVAVDDLTIQNVTDVPINTEIKVKTVGSRIKSLQQDLDRMRYRDGLIPLTRDFAVIVLSEGAGGKAHNARKQIVTDLNPDFVDWSPFGPLGKEYGIRSSKGGPEYQEYYKFEGPEVWENRYSQFVGSGFAVSLDGTIIQDETWGEGGYFTCQNGDNWHKFFKTKICGVASQMFSICQDNISCAPWLKGQGCFCAACESGFADYLRSRYSGEELAKLGIDNVLGFSAREYFLSHGRWGFGAVEDPIVREYIKYQHISQLEAWADHVAAIKAVGRQQGRAIPVYGNQIGAFGMWPFAIALSQFTDIIEIEEVIGVKDKIRPQSMYYKLGSASAYHERPVWIRGPVYDDTKKNTPMLKTSFWAVHFSEALANGGFRNFSLGMNAPWTGDPNTLDFMDDPSLYSLYSMFAGFIDDNRAIFTHRDSEAQVALVYSLPSLMFRRYMPIECDDNSAFERVQKTADLLDRQHIPYDALVFGHSEVWDDTRVLEKLSDYKVIVLPSIDAISDAQVAALKRFVEGGGKLIVADDKAGTRDENFNKRTSPALADIAAVDLNDKQEAALTLMKAASPVLIEAPETVTVNVWRSCGGKSLDIHLLNYDVDLEKDRAKPATGVKVAVKVPGDLVFDKAVWTRPGIRRLYVGFEREDDRVTFTVPTLDDYAVISLTTEDVLKQTNEEMQARRTHDREAVKKLAAEKNLY